MVSRRTFLETLIACSGLYCSATEGNVFAYGSNSNSFRLDEPFSTHTGQGKIQRTSLVRRHNPVLRGFEPLAPLSVGNGEFAFTADITGLQTFPRQYEKTMPLCSLSQWGWHTTPLPAGLDQKALRLKPYDAHGRQVGYRTTSEGQTEL